MANKDQSWFARLKRAIKTNDADTLAELAESAPETLTNDSGDLPQGVNLNINLSPQQPLPPEKELGGLTTDNEGITLESLAAQVAALTELVKGGSPALTTDSDDPDEEEEKKKSTTDAAYHQGVVSRAELILPGVKLPEGGKLAAFKRSTLDQAFKTPEGQALLLPLVGVSPDFAKMPKATLDATFVSAREIAKVRNSTAAAPARVSAFDASNKNSPAALNKAFAEHWKK